MDNGDVRAGYRSHLMKSFEAEKVLSSRFQAQAQPGKEPPTLFAPSLLFIGRSVLPSPRLTPDSLANTARTGSAQNVATGVH